MAARPIDPLEAEFRLKSARNGAWVTLIVCVPALVYALLGGGRSDRGAFVADFIVALLGGVVAFGVPWREIISSRWRELAFLAWTTIDLALVAVAVIADGGPASPVTFLFFIPIVFAGTSYPTWSVELVSAIATVGYAALAVAYQQPVGSSVMVLGGLCGVALMSWWQARSHEHRREQLARLVRTDPLTGALNRRGLDGAAAGTFAALERLGTPVALMILDLDDFKAYNDSHGHARGDELLTWTATQIRQILRPNDVFARIGGDEFVILAAGADLAAARHLADRIRAACAARAPHSMGIASAPVDGQNYDALYRVADRALYEDKQRRKEAGRAPPAGSSAVTSRARSRPPRQPAGR